MGIHGERNGGREGLATRLLVDVPLRGLLAAALNIPGELTHGYFAGQAHQTVLFEAIDGVLAHGDDVYNASLRNTPIGQLQDSHQRWVDEVLRYDPLEGPLSPAGYNSRIHHYEMARLFPSH
jgi:hypothetical protein